MSPDNSNCVYYTCYQCRKTYHIETSKAESWERFCSKKCETKYKEKEKEKD